MISILVTIVLFCLALWIIGQIPAKPEYAWVLNIGRVVVIVFFVIWLIYILAAYLPGPFFYPPPRAR